MSLVAPAYVPTVLTTFHAADAPSNATLTRVLGFRLSEIDECYNDPKIMERVTAVIIPVYNEGSIIKRTITEVMSSYPLVVCVNDGSQDNSSSELADTGAIVIEHPINLGQGAALQTGIEFVLQIPEVQYFVTFDADGQHDIDDVRAMLDKLDKDKLDIVLGSRFLGKANLNPAKRRLLKTATWFSNSINGTKLTDVHNGLRAFNRKVAEQLNISLPGMAHASEIIDKIVKNKWRYSEVPVTIYYSDYSRAKGQSMLNSVNIVIDLLVNKITK